MFSTGGIIAKKKSSPSTVEIDAELRRLGFNPIEIKIHGRVFIAALAENVRLRGELSKLRRENFETFKTELRKRVGFRKPKVAR